MQRTRILHVIPDFGPGGAERMAMHLLINTDAKRFDVAAVSLYDRQGTDIEQKLDSAGVSLCFLGKTVGIDLRMVRRLRAVLQQYRPAVLHTHRSVLRYLLPALCALPRTPIVHTVHNVATREVDKAGQLIHQLAFSRGMATPVCIAEKVAESVAETYGIRDLPLIPNGIPTAEYVNSRPRTAIRKELGLREEEIVFLSVGRLAKQKNQRLLIEAAAVFRRELALPIRVLIVGGGELAQELLLAARSLAISDCVQLLGNRQDIPDLLHAADVFVLSSDWEGNPLSLMEAMAAGKPVIATAVGGVPEMVANGDSGLLVPPGSVQAFAEAMMLLATQPSLRERLARRAAMVAEERFSVRSMVSAYEELYLKKITALDCVRA